MIRFAIVPVLLLLAAVPCRAQLDLGSQDIPQDSIDAYMAPFYRLAASALGSDRHLPEGDGFGWHAGLQGAVTPVPDRPPFEDADLSVLPMFRLEGGLSHDGIGIMARGLAWTDPRMGDLATFGGGLSLGRKFRGVPMPGLAGAGTAWVALVLGWDRLVFSSEYTYRYRGSLLALFDQDIPGDYTLAENLMAGGFQAALGLGSWRLHLEGMLESASGSFQYQYLDPRSGNRSRLTSDLEQVGLRVATGLTWKGFRLTTGWHHYPYVSTAWSYAR